MGFKETGGEPAPKKQPEPIGRRTGRPPSDPGVPTYIRGRRKSARKSTPAESAASLPKVTKKPRVTRNVPVPRPTEQPPSGDDQTSVRRGRPQRPTLRTKIGRTTDEIYKARCAQARFAELKPKLLDLSKLLESDFRTQERLPQRRSLSPAQRQHVIEAVKLIPWEDLADIAGLGSDHPAVTNLRGALEDGSVPPAEGREAVVKLREALIPASGDDNDKKRPESATPYVNEATEQESAGLRLADSLLPNRDSRCCRRRDRWRCWRSACE